MKDPTHCSDCGGPLKGHEDLDEHEGELHAACNECMAKAQAQTRANDRYWAGLEAHACGERE